MQNLHPTRRDLPGHASAAPDRHALLRALGHWREAAVASVGLGLSPESLLLAGTDWAIHLAGAPDKRVQLLEQLARMPLALLEGMLHHTAPTQTVAELTPPIPGTPSDRRFAAPAWQQEPFRSWAQAFLLSQHWWQHATRHIPGTEPHHEDVVAFMARQYLDWVAPSNQPWSNPEVLEHTLRQGGLNLLHGATHAAEDLARRLAGLPPVGAETFVVGRDLACTPGKVVMRNTLVELIQYQHGTASVYAEPVLLVPAWIMKYYILDLTPDSSLVRWLVARGHTVFCLSWRNVTEQQRNFGMDDYRRLGVMAAMDAIGTIVPGRKLHAMGYCLGGTLLAMAAAAMVRCADQRLASLTLLAAQTDFTEPGELQLFIDASQVRMLDSMMALRGYLTAEQMSMAFQMLRSTDLIWSRMVHEYMLGERQPMNALKAWNADSTRMPERMHSEYLHRLFLHNDLAAGRYLVHGHPAALQNLRLPIFAVGAEGDHVAPWRSVYKVHYLADTEVCFVLASGGHNAGIVSPPAATGPAGRHFRQHTKALEDTCLSADEWLAVAPVQPGSWWPQWQHWLRQHSTRKRVAPPPLGAAPYTALMDAPGRYVME